MINTKIYKAVYSLAEKLMEADRKGSKPEFDSLYGQLKDICTANENTDKDHPEQWETLADFTEDFDAALAVYEKAMEKAQAMNAKDHLSSIGLSMARLQIELGQTQAAISSLEAAKVNANKIEDKELKAEIDALLERLAEGKK
ncbi:MAG: tetratricopeptide repeat protein [Alcanivorax sediminis]|uniref:tetratricopeptide repeat protein n=1 Tax=Alcanivorax sediminis TaxID=2663008 RepID=UPI003C58B5EA